MFVENHGLSSGIDFVPYMVPHVCLNVVP